MYYNTVRETGEVLEKYSNKAKSQDEFIMNLMKDGAKLSASMIEPLMDVPITSIRRSLSTLMNEGKLIKLDVTVFGKYGRREHLYKKL